MLSSDLRGPDMTQDQLPSEPHFRFKAATLDALTQIVLEECSRAESTELTKLSDLSQGDESLGSWLKKAAASIPSEGSLSQQLLRHPGWLDTTEPTQQLWQIANMAVRLRTLEHQFTVELERQKREAIYHFAYGLSHELNNPLANIATRAGVLLQHESAADRRQMLETIVDNAMRGSEMLGDLMLIARPPAMQFTAVDHRQWFSAFLERARRWSSTRGVTIQTSEGLPQASHAEFKGVTPRFDPIALNEALWCLARNAIEVTPEGGAIEIRTELAENSSSIAWSILDEGPGLSAIALRHCFDPYFSGREAGRGLGLGLSKAQMIAVAHGGTLTVTNRLSGGCEARLTLPYSPNVEP